MNVSIYKFHIQDLQKQGVFFWGGGVMGDAHPTDLGSAILRTDNNWWAYLFLAWPAIIIEKIPISIGSHGILRTFLGFWDGIGRMYGGFKVCHAST
jgi:hypothetical protein